MKILWDRKDAVGILTISHPPDNRLTDSEFITPAHLKTLLNDEIKGLVIKGAGRHFSSGADLSAVKKLTNDVRLLRSKMKKGNEILNYIADLLIPTVAAIDGVCFGGGLEIALACDIRMCTERSLFAFPEINHGMLPGLGGIKRLESLCGSRVAMELCMGGDVIGAQKALELGVADKIISRKEHPNFASDYLQKLVEGRSISVVRRIMQSFRNARNLPADEAMREDVELFCAMVMEAVKSGQL